jgi:hypothetical protein
MTPKEKAIELVNEYLEQVRFSMEDCSFTYRGDVYLIATKITAKQCAIIAVNEIIKTMWHTHKNEIEYRYWQEVEQEILAL